MLTCLNPMLFAMASICNSCSWNVKECIKHTAIERKP
jgi:hypothetical protein